MLSITDIAPTLVDLAGGSSTAHNPWDGLSFARLLQVRVIGGEALRGLPNPRQATHVLQAYPGWVRRLPQAAWQPMHWQE